ncbi:hypothetical protein [Nitrolancea hollandica]|uniref:Uncharacterized protein n=1 Tax=Nitrolancea hollandica Lb TaxID=1129897 RepID=I4EHG6_9BACT|nr:hypothetical protein [Nitrolancea hollandica]CCF84128.1 hypothetical protein NITHO_3110001 [Nitrolancea hollandica Lb]
MTAHDITDAMLDLAIAFAAETGHESIYIPAANDWAPDDHDIAHALREPVSMGAVLQDLCLLLGIEPPRLVALANGAGCD